jgi:hypothetical protein
VAWNELPRREGHGSAQNVKSRSLVRVLKAEPEAAGMDHGNPWMDMQKMGVDQRVEQLTLEQKVRLINDLGNGLLQAHSPTLVRSLLIAMRGRRREPRIGTNVWELFREKLENAVGDRASVNRSGSALVYNPFQDICVE